MKVIATKVKASELEPGDLFSTAGPEYWELVNDMAIVGEKVYIRTNWPCPEEQVDYVVYKITIERDADEVKEDGK